MVKREDRIAREIVADLRSLFPKEWKRPDRLGFEAELRTYLAKRIRVEREQAVTEALERLDR